MRTGKKIMDDNKDLRFFTDISVADLVSLKDYFKKVLCWRELCQ